ncbi:MAG: glutamine synthetase family protein [archaeon]|nr:glutamine synthetase family protein [archaeon]
MQYPKFVAYHFLNGDGELRCMEEDGKNTEKFLKEGFNVDGSSIGGSMLTVEKSDLKVRPEKETFLHFQIGDFVHDRFMCHLENNEGQPHDMDPRSIFQKQIDKARKMGFEPYMFSEIEFYIVDENGKPVDNAAYCSLPPEDVSYDFRHELGELCKATGMAVKRIHHENGPGQNEIELNFQPCLKNADDSILTMFFMKMLAAKRKQKIIFSPKPFPTEAGNGLHHHILLRDVKTGENVFYNKDFKGNVDDPKECGGKLSDICRHGIAGLLKYADDITAVFAGNKETFERLKPGFEAPIFRAWDFSNRTALVRVPKSSLDMTRFEYRGGDLSYSIHYYGAVLLAAVLKGIEDKLPLQDNSNFNVEALTDEERTAKGIFSVPTSFEKCIEVLKGSKFLEETLGPNLVKHLIARDEEILKAGK